MKRSRTKLQQLTNERTHNVNTTIKVVLKAKGKMTLNILITYPIIKNSITTQHQYYNNNEKIIIQQHC